MALNFIALKYQIIFATLKLIQIWSCDVWLNLRDVNNIKNTFCENQQPLWVTAKSISIVNKVKTRWKSYKKLQKKKEENRNQTEQEKS